MALTVTMSASCGSSSRSTSGGGATTLPSSVCSQATALKQSLQDLKNVNVVQNGTSALSDAVATVKSNANALSESTHGQLKPQVDALQASLDQLESAIRNVGSGGLTPVTNALSSVTDAANGLSQGVKNLKC
jgi:hypothetical protein